ncbi:hypothetical protein D3C87_2066370 [compost metagenome]
MRFKPKGMKIVDPLDPIPRMSSVHKRPQLAWVTINYVPNIPGWNEKEQVNKDDVLQCSDAHVHSPHSDREE